MKSGMEWNGVEESGAYRALRCMHAIEQYFQELKKFSLAGLMSVIITTRQRAATRLIRSELFD